MRFIEALKAMKNGAKVKLPSWGGYWCWDAEKETVMIHCRPQDSDHQGEILDIRETQRVEYTLSNVASEDWVIADEENCPVLGGEAMFGFGDAIRYLKRGLKVARKGWNGKEMFLFVADEIHFFTKTELKKKNDEPYDMLPSITMKTADNKCVVGWVPSQTDMFAEDWVFVD